MYRTICIYTSTRAEYGLLRNLIKEIDQSPELRLSLLVSGTHLVPDQGMTIEEIQNDGLTPDESIDIRLGDDSMQGICRSMGVALSEYGRFLAKTSPDLLVLLGDRFETFCCAAAAQVCRVPVAHIHGGETTQGAMDESFRHSITKMSQIHFPCCETYRNRIIQMGEHPDCVYTVGALGVENIRQINFMAKDQLEQSLDFSLDRPFFLITFHPVTLDAQGPEYQFKSLLNALDQFEDHKFIFTGSNADTGGSVINRMQQAFAQKIPDRCFVAPSLGYLRYLSAMKYCKAVVGNSSSGILEAPALRVPTVNVGDRQEGRVRTRSIIDCDPKTESIVDALVKVSDASFLSQIQDMAIPFEKPGTSKMIKKVLQTADLSYILKKQFFDIGFQYDPVPKGR